MTVPQLALSIPAKRSFHSKARPASKTNTLVIAGIPRAFFQPEILGALRTHFSSYGELYAWAPIKAFGRIITVFHAETAAENAKLCCDGFKIEATPESPKTTLRVFRADPTPIRTSAPSSGASSPGHPLDRKFSPFHLAPPAIEKNFLISPPGSPPVGWESMREEMPNNAPLADDLISALRRLEVSQERERRGGSPSISVLLEPEEGPGVGVYVQECEDETPAVNTSLDDGDREGVYQGEAWFYGTARARFVPAPTCRPPLAASA